MDSSRCSGCARRYQKELNKMKVKLWGQRHWPRTEGEEDFALGGVCLELSSKS